MASVVCFFTAVVPVEGPDLELSTASNPVYPDQGVIFTCITRRSPILAWRCDDYLGEGVLIEFIEVDVQGKTTIMTSVYNSNVTAMLTDKNSANHMLRSTLHIIAAPGQSLSNITCINVGQSLRKDIILSVFSE